MENIERQNKLKDIMHRHADERICHHAATLFKHLCTADGKAVLGKEVDNFILKHHNKNGSENQ